LNPDPATVTESSIVIDEQDILHAICGFHDENLQAVEVLIGEPVFLRGNEIMIRNNNHEVSGKFTTLIRDMEKWARNKRSISPELIRSYGESLFQAPHNSALLRNVEISIPQGFAKVFPRTANQAEFVKSLQKYDMVFGIGPAGTGKTYLAIAHALSEILSHKKKRLILTRPVVEAGENLGFLPGDLAQKLDPYIRPLYDAMYSLVSPEVITRLEETRVIEIAPLAYMRGRSLRDAYIVLDEAQNATREQMKMFLTRLGENSKAVITGDATQTDLPVHKISGLLHARTILAGIDDIAFCDFHSQDVVRSHLVRKIIQAYDVHEQKQTTAEPQWVNGVKRG